MRAQFDRPVLRVEPSTPDALAAVVARDAEAWQSFVRENDVPQE